MSQHVLSSSDSNGQSDKESDGSFSKSSNDSEEAEAPPIIQELIDFLKKPEVEAHLTHPYILKIIGEEKLKKIEEDDKIENMKQGITNQNVFEELERSTDNLLESKKVNNGRIIVKAAENRNNNPTPNIQNRLLKARTRRSNIPMIESHNKLILFRNNKFTNKVTEDELMRHSGEMVNSYLPIGVFLSDHLALSFDGEKLWPIFQKQEPSVKSPNLYNIHEDQKFFPFLLRSILNNNEKDVLIILFKKLKTMVVILEPSIISLFEEFSRYSFMNEFYKQLLSAIKNDKNRVYEVIEESNQIESLNSSKEEYRRSTLSHQKIILMIKKYMVCSDTDDLLLQILKALSLSSKETYNLLIKSREELRVMSILRENKELMDHFDPEELVKQKIFPLLILCESPQLIAIFNLEPDSDHLNNHTTVFEEICERIGNKIDVELLINTIIHVHPTFWDMEKLPKFYEALKKLFTEDSKEDENNGSEEREFITKDCWLILLNNPLLNSIKLVQFFEALKTQLGFKHKPITDLTESLVNFCKMYLQQAKEDVLVINMFEKDINGKDFMDYALLVQDKTLIEIESVDGIIQKMWDLGRHTMQSIGQFLRIRFMYDNMKGFNMSVFIKRYEVPIEENDIFSMEYRFASGSVLMKVISEIGWHSILVFAEFIFSFSLIRMYKEDSLNPGWVSNYWEQNRVACSFYMYLRLNLFISSICRTIIHERIHWNSEIGMLHDMFHQAFIYLNIIQIIGYPLIFSSNKWIFINLQMLMVSSLIYYILYNALSLPHIGPILRIFTRFVIVTLIFGVSSLICVVLIGYVLHTIYIDFSQVVGGSNELNMFRDLYNGILTLYEFIFGSVVFVRPYIEENLYTYSMSFLMVLFTFFGNIMLANIMVTFLTAQFREIRLTAKYLTSKMQFNMAKHYKLKNLEAIYCMPYPFTIFTMVCYPFMMSENEMRRKLNLKLKRFVHIINVFMPIFILTNIYNLVMVLVRYIQIFVLIMVRIRVNSWHVLYTFARIFGGPFFLIKLGIQDIGTIFNILQKFEDLDENALTTHLSEQSKTNLIKIFALIRKRVYQHIQKHKKEKTVTIARFLAIMDMEYLYKDYVGRTIKGIFPDNERGTVNDSLKNYIKQTNGEEDFEEECPNLFGYSAKLNYEYTKSIDHILVNLLKKFGHEVNSRDVLDMEINLDLMLNKFKNNINYDNIDRLVGFDLATLQVWIKNIQTTKDQEIRFEIIKVRDHIDSMINQMDAMIEMIDSVKKDASKKLRIPLPLETVQSESSDESSDQYDL